MSCESHDRSKPMAISEAARHVTYHILGLEKAENRVHASFYGGLGHRYAIDVILARCTPEQARKVLTQVHSLLEQSRNEQG